MSTAAKFTIALWVALIVVILFMSRSFVLDFPSLLDIIRPISRQATAAITKDWLVMILSILTAGLGLFVVLFRSGDELGKNWCYAAIGTVLGYWLCHYTI